MAGGIYEVEGCLMHGHAGVSGERVRGRFLHISIGVWKLLSSSALSDWYDYHPFHYRNHQVFLLMANTYNNDLHVDDTPR